jgi:predicted nucleotidyltransferase
MAKFGATNVRVFGSAARGEVTAGSDLDLLVRMEEGASLFDLIGLSQELEDNYFGVDLDLVWDVVAKELPATKDRLVALIGSVGS